MAVLAVPAERGKELLSLDRLAEAAWTEANIAVFAGHRARLVRLGWDSSVAEGLADQLVNRDREGDDMRMCVECRNLERSGRCRAARAGRLPWADRMFTPMATTFQRCEEFRPLP